MPVYIIQADAGGPVKIGWSVSPQRRLKILQIGHPSPLEVIRIIDGPKRLEKLFHREFSANHLGGEWFTFDDRMLELTADNFTMPEKAVTQKKQLAPRPAAFVLREARIAAGISQGELAEHLGMTQPTVAKIESGFLPFYDRYVALLPESVREPVAEAVIEEHRAMIKKLYEVI